MKTYHLLTTALFSVILLVNGTLRSFAQSPSDDESTKGGTTIRAFSIIHKAEKVYLNWKVKKEVSDCVYVIEKSEGNGQFKPLGVKEGFASPFTLLYSFVDKTQAASNNVAYRLKKISSDNKVQYFAPLVEEKAETGSLNIVNNVIPNILLMQSTELSIQ